MLFRSDGAHPRYQALADDLIKLAWDQRGVYTIDFLPIAEGIRVALEPRSGPGPLLIGDYTDNPGGGAHGDGTSFLKALLESKVEDAVVGHIADPESAKIGIDAGIGATVTLNLTPELLAKTPAGEHLRTREGKVFAVPETSVIDTGSQKVVYRETLPHTFEGVKVQLGAKMTNAEGVAFYPVLKGLAEDDRIVTAGSFLIDAETRLDSAVGTSYIGGSVSKGGTATLRPTTPDNQAEIIAASMQLLNPNERKLAQAQQICPIQRNMLGAMGKPKIGRAHV